MKIGAIILSGDDSSRIDVFLPLMELGKKHLLARTVDLFQNSDVGTIIVVTGHRKGEVRKEAERLGIQTAHNKRYDEGMFSSVCTGVKQLSQVKRLDAFFVLSVDTPLIRPSTISTLCRQKRGNDIAYPAFLKERGQPPLIPSKFIPSILKFSGKGGFKAFLEKQSSIDVPVWDEGILLHAGSPKHLELLKKRLALMDMGSRLEVETLSKLIMRKRGQEHGLAVADIACKIGGQLNKKGYTLNLDLLFNGGLLHDIAKGESQHEEKGAELLKRLGLSRLAPIVSAHRDTTFSKSGQLTEKEIVCLADKLVRGTNRMPVKERFGEKLELYTGDTAACKAIKKRLANVKKIEGVVVDCLGRSLEDVLNLDKKH